MLYLHKRFIMGFLDIILALLLLRGLWRGFKNGLLLELASIIALIAGIFGAIHFSYIAGDYLSEHMQWNESYINLASFIITLVVIMIAVHFAGKLLTAIANIAFLGLINKIAGGLFGVLRAAIILGAILAFFEQVNSTVGFIGNETLQSSILFEPVKEIGKFFFSMVLRG